MELIGCPEKSVRDCHSSLLNIPGEHRSHLQRGRSLNSRTATCLFVAWKMCAHLQLRKRLVD